MDWEVKFGRMNSASKHMFSPFFVLLYIKIHLIKFYLAPSRLHSLIVDKRAK